MTLTFILDQTEIPVEGLLMDTKGPVSGGDQRSFVHHPDVVLTSKASQEDVLKVQELFVKAEEQCHVGQLLTKAGVSIGIEGKVICRFRGRYSKQIR